MKSIILFIWVFCLTILFGYGQQLPNNDFEEWEDSGFKEPLFWNTPNPYTNIAGIGSVVFKSDSAYSGIFSAHLETKIIPIYNILAPGVITLADFSLDVSNQTFSYSGGYFLQQNVQKLTGMFKYQGVANDSAVVLIYNFRNREGEEYDTIGNGYAYLHDAKEWTPFTVNMRYLNGHVPDTFNILIMSTTDEGITDITHDGSVMLVDSLAIHTNTGIINLWEKPIALHVYPNPATSVINFETDETGKNRKLIISDPTAKIISRLSFKEKTITFDLSEFSSGIYSYSVVEANRIVNSGSFIIN